jgi:hypothetical protein
VGVVVAAAGACAGAGVAAGIGVAVVTGATTASPFGFSGKPGRA